MLPISARWSLRLPRQHIRALATRNSSTPKPRSSLRRDTSSRIPVPRPPPAQRPSGKNIPAESSKSSESPSSEPSKVEAVSKALATTPDAENNLITPVYMPEDPNAVLKETHPAMRLLDNSAIVVQRQLEMMNVLMGFEQANRYVIMDPHGNHIGYLAERDHGLGSAVARQMFKTHRSFTTHVFDREEKEILRFHRPFAWVNSRIRVYDAVGRESAYTSSPELQGNTPGSIINQTSASVSSLPMSDMRIIGSAEQEWAPLRRKYNLFVARQIEDAEAGTPQLTSGDLPLSSSKAMVVAEDDKREIAMLQFARVDEPFLSWDFSLKSEDGRLIGSVNRNFGGFAREIFTDTGIYALRMDAAGLAVGQDSAQPSAVPEHQPGMTLDQRAVMLATAVSVDFDYFSRHSGSGGLFPMWPIWMPWGGGAAEGAAGGVAAGEAAGAGAVGAAGETGIAGEVGAAARGAGSAEGWVAGAGTMAGYEAMKGARGGGGQQVDSQSPQANEPFSPEQQVGNQQGEDVWGQTRNPWDELEQDNDFWGGGKGGGDGGSSGGQGGGGGEGGDGFDFGDWF